jgi:transcriptional regulator GlxA family with amidase domain
MNIAIPIFDRLTALDAVGPYEVLSRLPGARVHFIAEETGPKRTETKMLGLVADGTFAELPEPEVIVVPGGFGTRGLMEDETMLAWLRHAHAHSQWTTSVCTGSLLLAAAGILDGLEATTHWLELDHLAECGAIAVGDRRVVEQGKVITAAGVSAGIDMALMLAARIGGEQLAQAIQLGIEYDPQPPFVGGSTQSAPQEIIELVTQHAGQLA